jgi:lysophospholipase L1-like esterase
VKKSIEAKVDSWPVKLHSALISPLLPLMKSLLITPDIGKTGLLVTAYAVCVLVLSARFAWATPPMESAHADDSRWDQSIAAFVAADRVHTPESGGVLFIGSSSIRLWDDVENKFGPAVAIIKRGFGGATMSACEHYLDRIVLPYKPRLIVVYAGDNDLAQGYEPREVLDHFIRFVERVRSALPSTRIAFISIKPSPARIRLVAKMRETNELVRRYIESGDNLDFINVFTLMLDAAGRPRAELFQADALHLNSVGYQLWQTVIAPHLR